VHRWHFNLAGIVGGSLAPYVATWLALRYGLACVGYYLSAAAATDFRGVVAHAFHAACGRSGI
jgi:predicted esterase YcpF (UPF0227 family)